VSERVCVYVCEREREREREREKERGELYNWDLKIASQRGGD
jgi:hypothetical protein